MAPVPFLPPADIRASPAWFPLKATSPGNIGWVRLDEAAYAAASFLDDRMLTPGRDLIAWDSVELERATDGMPCRSHYIFHTGHVGSTLMSRLVGEHRQLFSLREPQLLRSLAGVPSHPPGVPVALDTLVRLLSRTWRADQRAVVKATSFVSELAHPLMTLDSGSRALFMYAQPLAYLRGIMAGATSRAETKLMAGARLARLAARVSSRWDLAALSEGEWVAMSWLSEMTTLHEAAQRHPHQVLWVDFDHFLDAPERTLPAILLHLGAAAGPTEIATLLRSPVMHRYSKGPEHAYDAALRRDVLRSADFEQGGEIQKGLDWLQNAASGNDTISALFASR